MLAGAGAGAITKTSIAPLERIKILFQIQGMKKDGIGENRQYKNVFQASSKILNEEGFLAFYKGNGANVLRVIPVYALKFAFNDAFKTQFCTIVPPHADSMSPNGTLSSSPRMVVSSEKVWKQWAENMSKTQGHSTTSAFDLLLP